MQLRHLDAHIPSLWYLEASGLSVLVPGSLVEVCECQKSLKTFTPLSGDQKPLKIKSTIPTGSKQKVVRSGGGVPTSHIFCCSITCGLITSLGWC